MATITIQITGGTPNPNPATAVQTYASHEPLWRMRAGLPDSGMDETWISGLSRPSDVAAVLRAV
jgi:hypothetical protein